MKTGGAPAAVRSGDPVRARIAGGPLFDWTATYLSALFMAGGILDVWAHNHQDAAGGLESFFTPWHAVLYSGWLLVTAFLLLTALRNRSAGLPWRGVLPAGYPLALLGTLIFTGGGLFDMLWHLAFGIEEGLEATYSPSHLLLGAGLVLVMSGPLRAGWRRREPGGWLSDLPMVISLALTLTSLTLYVQFADPVTSPWAAATHRDRLAGRLDLGHTIGLAGVLLYSAVVMGLLLATVLRRRLPPGALTVTLTTNALLMAIGFGTAPYPPLVLRLAAVVLAGIAADVLLHQLEPSASRPGALRIFAAGVPAALYALHFTALMASPGLWWSAHLWTGAVALSALAGLLLSYAFVPPGARAPWRGGGPLSPG